MSTDKQSIDWYNQNAKAYTDHVKNPQDSVYHSYYEKPAMYSLVPDIKGKKVISLGSGPGEDISYLKKLGAEKTLGIDISTEIVKIAQENHPNCDFEVMDMEHLNLPDSSFDFAYSSLAIHYIENWTKVFKEVYRILKPNSYFLFSCGHPVRYSMGKANTDTQWINKLEIIKDKETKEITITGDYLNRTKLTNGFGKDTVTTWNKSFSEISSEITLSGFLIEQIIEPRPTEEMKNLFPEKYKKLNKIPEFVIFRLLKK
jgi:ubiquinone/menaquinone biosynthesis C-methylase UbiE